MSHDFSPTNRDSVRIPRYTNFVTVHHAHICYTQVLPVSTK